MTSSIPKDAATEICRQNRLDQITRWYSWFFTPCWSCMVYSNGNPDKMRIADQPGYTGCPRVNARYLAQGARAASVLSKN